MAGTVNKVILVGRLGKDPEVRSFQNGGKVVNMTLATSETWTDRSSGERKEKTQWHNVVIKNEKTAEVAEKYLKKGAMVYVEGALETRKYQDPQSGQERFFTEVIVGPFRGEMTMLGGRNDDGGSGGGGGGYAARERDSGSRDSGRERGGSGAPSRGSTGGPSWDSPRKGGGDLDDEIPF